jgi:hypothetical protein
MQQFSMHYPPIDMGNILVLGILKKRAHTVLEYSLQCQRLPIKRQKLTELDGVMVYSGLKINLDVIPVIMTGGSLNLPVTVEFMPVIVTP